MTPARSIDAQIDDRGRNAGTSLCGGGNRDHRYEHHDIAGSSSLRHGRGSKARPNCRGVTASALSFTPRSLDLDEISELRTRRLSGAAALILNPLHHQACKLSDAAEVVQVETPLVHEKHRDRKEFAGVRTAFQGSRNVF